MKDVFDLQTWIDKFGEENLNLDKLKEYLEFVQEAERSRDLERYSEWHHVIPKCFDKEGKYVKYAHLNGADHFRAHMKLVECFVSDFRYRIVSALSRMKGDVRGISPEDWEKARKVISEEHSKRMTGYVVSEETRRRIKLNHADFKGINHPSYGKKRSMEQKSRMSVSAKNKPPMTEETKIKISKANKGKTISQEHKDSIIRHQSGSSNSFYGKHRTEEVKEILREKSKGNKSTSGRVWINDGSSNKMIFASEMIPNGWSRGMIKRR